MITLYNMQLSGNCYKIRLMLSILELPYRTINLTGGAQREPDHLQRNPLGQAPVLDDDGLIIRDSQAILVYLAKRYGGDTWWPDDAYSLGQIAAWLSTSANEIANGPAVLRLHQKFRRDIEVASAWKISSKILDVIDHHLQHRDWLVGGSASIADIAVYPYLALSPEGGIAIGAYPNIVAWFQRIRALPGYVPMPGMWA